MVTRILAKAIKFYTNGKNLVKPQNLSAAEEMISPKIARNFKYIQLLDFIVQQKIKHCNGY